MAKPMPTSEQAQADWTHDETANVTTTVVRKSVPSGASFVDIGLFKSTASAATALWLYVAVNALSNAEEDTILANPGPQRLRIPIGTSLRDMCRLQSDVPITRYAFRTDAVAESVGNVVIQHIGSAL